MKRSIALFMLCAVPGVALAAPAATLRVLNADIPAAAIKKLELHVGVGEVHVKASADDQVHVQVTLKQNEREFLWFFHWMSTGTAKDIAGAAIQQQTEGDVLDLGLNYKGDSDSNDLKQEWEVQLPVRLALHTDMKVGELTIKDVAGGVEATLNVGELTIEVPRGHLKGDVNVGEIRAKSGSTDRGRINVSSSIGEAVIYINGSQNGYHDHGGLGNSVTVDGKGHDDMSLSVNIGEASLRIQPPDPAKTGDGK